MLSQRYRPLTAAAAGLVLLMVGGFLVDLVRTRPPENCPRSRYERGRRYYSQFYEDYILGQVFAFLSDGLYVERSRNVPRSSFLSR